MTSAARKQPPGEQAYYTTTQAAALIGKSPKALRHAVLRGQLVPAARGQRGRHKEHMFTRDQLDAYILGTA